MKLFGSNYSEIGSLSDNLVLLTAGKIKVRFGKKFIDILDNEGNLNVQLPKIITKIDSLNEMKSNGFYLLEENLYMKYEDVILLITSNSGNYVEYGNSQILTEEQIKIVQNNIGLSFKDFNNIPIKEGIIFVGNNIYKIKSGVISEFLQEPLNSINSLKINPTQDDSTLVWNKSWKYVPIVTLKTFNEFRKKIYLKKEKFPINSIIMWYGQADNVPDGWVICDGTKGTPDLRDKFVIGAGNNYEMGTFGGESEVTLSLDQIPSHSHNINNVSVLSKSEGQLNLETSSTGNIKEIDTLITSSSGGGLAHNNLPPYCALYYIMRVETTEEENIEDNTEEENNN